MIYQTCLFVCQIILDLQARGIDIPMLDNVINYNFPSKPKLFVHRVGRVARAGRSGTAYSLLSPDELPYLLDLHLFLGKAVTLATPGSEERSGVLGSVPHSVLGEEDEFIQQIHQTSSDLVSGERMPLSMCGFISVVANYPAQNSQLLKTLSIFPSILYI